jgi:hypothetical protein
MDKREREANGSDKWETRIMEHTQSFTLSTNCISLPMASRLSYEAIQEKDRKIVGGT